MDALSCGCACAHLDSPSQKTICCSTHIGMVFPPYACGSVVSTLQVQQMSFRKYCIGMGPHLPCHGIADDSDTYSSAEMSCGRMSTRTLCHRPPAPGPRPKSKTLRTRTPRRRLLRPPRRPALERKRVDLGCRRAS